MEFLVFTAGVGLQSSITKAVKDSIRVHDDVAHMYTQYNEHEQLECVALIRGGASQKIILR